ncbi:MAG: hypothetical protein ABW066_08025 [Sedimenticola sp.]
MDDDDNLEEERQRIFTMVWERPATDVAKELGISDVALGKMCRQLQVPKPPRGYWAKIESGKKLRRPPLPAYRAELKERLRKESRSRTPIRLSKLQLEFLKFTLNELAANDIDTSSCELAYDGIRSVNPELAAQILILLQRRYEKWVAERTTARSINGAITSIGNLVDKLIPHARAQLLLFHRRSEDRNTRASNGPTISLRANQDFLVRITNLAHIARTSGLVYVVADMSALEHAWSVKHIYSPRAYSKAKTELCVSSNEVWIRADLNDDWYRDRFETVRLSLRDICPIELLPTNECKLPPKIRMSSIKRYAERLDALKKAEAIYDSLVNSTYDMNRTVPDEKLALFDRLWFTRGTNGPLTSARQAWHKIESDLEHWEQELEVESASLCRDVLGNV